MRNQWPWNERENTKSLIRAISPGQKTNKNLPIPPLKCTYIITKTQQNN